MPAPIELLYRLTARDAQGGLFGYFARRYAVTVNNLPVATINMPVADIPEGYILQVTNLVVRGEPGAGITIIALRASIVETGQPAVTIIGSDTLAITLPATGQIHAGGLDINLRGGRQRIQAEMLLNAAPVVSTLHLNVCGTFFPVGSSVKF